MLRNSRELEAHSAYHNNRPKITTAKINKYTHPSKKWHHQKNCSYIHYKIVALLISWLIAMDQWKSQQSRPDGSLLISRVFFSLTAWNPHFSNSYSKLCYCCYFLLLSKFFLCLSALNVQPMICRWSVSKDVWVEINSCLSESK